MDGPLSVQIPVQLLLELEPNLLVQNVIEIEVELSRMYVDETNPSETTSVPTTSMESFTETKSSTVTTISNGTVQGDLLWVIDIWFHREFKKLTIQKVFAIMKSQISGFIKNDFIYDFIAISNNFIMGRIMRKG